MSVIEARAVITATDKTGAAFASVAGKFKELNAAAKSFAGLKPIPDWGSAFQKEVDKMRLSAQHLKDVQRSWEQLHASMRAGGQRMKAADYFGSINQWKSQTLTGLRQVRAEYDRMNSAGNRALLITKALGSRALMLFGVGSLAYGAARAGRAAVRETSESTREDARDYLAGLTPRQTELLNKRALEVSGRFPSIGQSAMHERLRDTAMSMGSVDKALGMADVIAQGHVVLQSLKGKDRALEEGRKFFRALDTLGRNVEPERVKKLYDGFIRAVGVEGADLNLTDIFTMVRGSKAAGNTLSDRFLMTTAVGLIGDLTAPTVGKALGTSFSQLIGNRATKESKTAMAKFGLRDKSGLVNQSQFLSDPDLWVWNTMLPALRKRGVDTTDETAVNKLALRLFSNQNVADIITKMALQEAQYRRKAEQFERAPGLPAAQELRGKDPFVAAEGVSNAITNLVTVLASPYVPAAVASMNSLADGINKMATTLARQQNFTPAVARTEALERPWYSVPTSREDLIARRLVNPPLNYALPVPGDYFGRLAGEGSAAATRASSPARSAAEQVQRLLPLWRPGGSFERMPGPSTRYEGAFPPHAAGLIPPSPYMLAPSPGGVSMSARGGDIKATVEGPVEAELRGQADVNVTVKVEPADGFWARVQGIIGNATERLRVNVTGSSSGPGSTGKSLPEAGAPPVGSGW